MSEWRSRPPPTLQGALTCWAAAISSFSRVTPGVTDWKTPAAVVKHFKTHFPDELLADRPHAAAVGATPTRRFRPGGQELVRRYFTGATWRWKNATMRA